MKLISEKLPMGFIMFPVTHGIENGPILMGKSISVPKYIRGSIKVHITRVKSVKTQNPKFKKAQI